MGDARTVLMTADAAGGVITYAIELSRALARHGTRVVLAVMGGAPSATQRAAALAVPGLALHTSEYRLEWMDDPWEDVARAGEWLLAIEERTRPDVVHLNGYAHGALPFRAPKLVVAHSCVLSWFEAVEGRPAPAQFDRYRREVAAGIASAAALVAPTRAMLEVAVRHYGAHPRAWVIPNGRDAERFQPAAKEEAILSIGRLWDQAKNVAALSVAAGGLPWPVRVAGSAEAPGGGRRALSGVEHLGLLSEDEVASALARAAIYAAPARYEPFGLSILESALSGCALVLGDIPSLRELWSGAALFVDPADPEDLRRALCHVIADRELRAALGERARLAALRYSAERTALAYLALYDELIARPAVAPRHRAPAASPRS